LRFRFSCLLLALNLLTGCAAFFDGPAWPGQAYPRDYFVAAYREDNMAQMYQTEDDYLLWVTRFYYGSTIAPGWLDLTRQVLDKVGQPDRRQAADRLFHLGGRIGSEWAKPNGVRRLNTRNAAVWRDALIESIAQGELFEYMDRVENDVESIIAGELDSEEIYFERYYVDEFDF